MIGILAFTERGEALAKRVAEIFPDESCIFYYREKDSAREFVKKNFNRADKLIFIGALGITVRLIAAHILKKDEDPAVICIDEMGKHVISVLSGHIGGGNELACYIAEKTGAQPVITTATDLSGIWACDVWAVKNDCKVANTEEIKTISAGLLNREKIGFKSHFSVTGEVPGGIYMVDERVEEFSKGICLCHDENEKPFRHTLNLIPRNIVVGVGCRRDTDSKAFEEFILENLHACKISVKAVSCMASIDLKKEEKCIEDFCEKYKIPRRFFSAEELMKIKGSFHHSDFVERTTGTDNVCERSAAAAGAKEFILEKKSKDGMTAAIGAADWEGEF